MQSRYQPIRPQGGRPQSNSPALMERLIAAMSYLTMGFVGFLWFLLAIFTKNNIRPFLKYHIFQSLFISIAYFLFSQFLGLIMNLLSIIPIVNQLVMRFTFYLNAPVLLSFSLIQIAIYFVLFYLVLTSLQGQFSYLPWVSDIIKANVKNS